MVIAYVVMRPSGRNSSPGSSATRSGGRSPAFAHPDQLPASPAETTSSNRSTSRAYRAPHDEPV